MNRSPTDNPASAQPGTSAKGPPKALIVKLVLAKVIVVAIVVAVVLYAL